MLSKLSIWQIKAELYKRSLKVSGSKNELVLRLSEALEKDGVKVEDFYNDCVAQRKDVSPEEPEISQTICQPDTGAINKELSPIQRHEPAQSNLASSWNRKDDVRPEDSISNYSRSSRKTYSSEVSCSKIEKARIPRN